MNIYQNILEAKAKNKKLLAVLIDPEKMDLENVSSFFEKVHQSFATHIFIGGSTVDDNVTERIVNKVKHLTKLPVVLFPGDVTQISDKADALLFLSLISGNNSEYLIGKHVQAASTLRNSNLEVIPTGYILIENGKPTAVEKVTQTKPLSRDNTKHIIDTAKAGELLGMQLLYLEAGSGAIESVPNEIISFVKKDSTIPLIVGGGIRSLEQLEMAYKHGADLVVIGTAFEEDESFFNELKK